MSLAKQLFALISLLFLFIFSVNYFTGVSNIRNYLQTEAQIHAQDTATSLGVALQPHVEKKNDTYLPTLINVVFDRGYYLNITLKDLNDTILVERSNPQSFKIVPHWFSTVMPLEVSTAITEINKGWNIVAVLSVSVHPGYGYLKLWQQAKSALLYSSIAYLFSLFALALLLRVTLKPLERIEKLAILIGEGNYQTITPLPWTKEIKKVAQAMNLMSEKISQVIQSLQNRLGDAEKKLHTDPVTGLESKSSFEPALKQMFVAGEKGFLFLLQVDNLGEFAQEKPRETVDAFLQDLAKSLLKSTKTDVESQVFRISGSEFAIIAKGIEKRQAETLCTELSNGFKALEKSSGKIGVAHIGGIAFDPLGTSDTLVSAAQESYSKAKLIGQNSYVIGEDGTSAHSKDEWMELVKSNINDEKATIAITDSAIGLLEEDLGKVLLEEATAKVIDTNNEPLPIGTFVSVAEEMGLVTRFDMLILKKTLEHIGNLRITHNVAVNLSFSSLSDQDFRSELYNLLNDKKGPIANIVFCITAYGAAKDLQLLHSFNNLVKRLGAKLMVKRYEPRFMPLETLKGFNFDYIRLAKSLTENIVDDMEKQTLISTMVETGNLLDTTILAEKVTESDWKIVSDLGIHGASKNET